jgi:hypothetical protein
VSTPLEEVLDADIVDFLRAELPSNPEEDLPIDIWYRRCYLNHGHGFAPYGYVIADFLEEKRDRFDRITEIGAGFGQNCVQFAARGWQTIAVDGAVRQAAALERLIARLEVSYPEICRRIEVRAPLIYPQDAGEYLDARTVAFFSSLRQSYDDPETERRLLESLRLAGGLVFDAHVFFVRREQDEQDRLLEFIRDLGFDPSVLVWDWPGMSAADGTTIFQYHRFVYFQRGGGPRSGAGVAASSREVAARPTDMRRVTERWERRWEILIGAVDEMLDLPLEESWRYQHDPAGVSVRRYPFPYVAALTVSNDLDSMTRPAFEDWHGFVNGRRPTRYGDGLGLEIGDSMWVWGTQSSFPSLHRQPPQEYPREDSADLDRVVELGRLGWLDTMHSLTGWDSPVTPRAGLPGPEHANPPHLRVTRGDARYALDRLNDLGIKPPLYVNHSCAITNIAAEWPWLQHADEPEHESYCLDLLKQFGFRFFWQDVAVDGDRFPGDPKFGDFLDFLSKFHLRCAVARFDWERWLMSRTRDETGGLVGAMIELPEDSGQRRAKLAGYFNRTFFKARAGDGTDIFIFKRFNGVDTPSASNFAAQVTSSRLDMLERGGGTVIVYNHFGNWSMLGRGRTRRDLTRTTNSAVFDEHGVACWQEIAERHRAGRLFVATSARLLDYLWLRESLKLSTAKTDDKWIVTLHGLECDVLGRRAISPDDLNGLSFLVPQTAPDIVVTIAGRRAPLALTRTSDPAFRGSDVLYRPWQALEWPDT